MYCPECAKQNIEGAVYCGYCGCRLRVLRDHDPAYGPELPGEDLFSSDSQAMEEEESTEPLKEESVDAADKAGNPARKTWKNRFWIMGILWLIAPYAGQLILLNLPDAYIKRITDLFINSAVYGQLSAEMAGIGESISNSRFSGLSGIIPMAGRTVSLVGQFLRAAATIIVLIIRTLPASFLPLIILSGLLIAGRFLLERGAAWRLFKKAGMAPWKSIIPVYNIYCRVKIATHETKLFWRSLIVILCESVVSGVFIRQLFTLQWQEGAPDTEGIKVIVLLIILIVLLLYALVLTLKVYHSMGVCFGHGRTFLIVTALVLPLLCIFVYYEFISASPYPGISTFEDLLALISFLSFPKLTEFLLGWNGDAYLEEDFGWKMRSRRSAGIAIAIIAGLLAALVAGIRLSGRGTELNMPSAVIAESEVSQTEVTSQSFPDQEDSAPGISAQGTDSGNSTVPASAQETPSQPSTDTCMGGGVTVTYIGFDTGSNTVTLRIENNMDDNIALFGLPTQIINGQSVSLDPYANMSVTGGDEILPNTYRDITFTVDAQLLDAGGTIQGELFILNPTIGDRIYSIDIAAK